jgi:phosphate-selective porin OprO/OprP
MMDFSAGGVSSNVGVMEDGTEFRRARLLSQGALYDVGYKFQVDFAGDPDITSMYLAFPSPVPNSGIKVGKFKEDISLVERTSSKYITFIARPMLSEFTGGREIGIRLGGAVRRGTLTYGVGVYRDKIDDALGTSRGDGDYKGVGRATYVPWQADGGRKLVHIGASGSLTSLDAADPVKEAHEPEVHLAPDFVDTGPISADRTTRFGVESALVYERASVQAEYLQRTYDRAGSGANPTFDAWYVSGTFFLTDEHRSYDGGEFGRVVPDENVRAGRAGGMGAWELAARYSTMDLTDSGIVGGEAAALTVGVNWYLNPSVRLMANYTRAEVDGAVGAAGVDGRGDFVSVRAQLDF